MSIFQRTEVNTGRQTEIDLVKGFLMILIVFIHSFQTIANEAAVASEVYLILFGSFMQTGACLFLFIMGFGSVYSKRNAPKNLAISGVKLVWFQALSNVCSCVCIILPFALRNVIWGEIAGSRSAYEALLYAMITFLNIFFISGMCYLVLALLKLLKVPVWGYAVIAAITAGLSPVLGRITSDNYALNWLLDATFGGKGETSFCFFPYISFVLLGYVFAKVLRRVKESDKKKFYAISGAVGLVITIIWFIALAFKYSTLGAIFDRLYYLYRIPGILKVVTSCASILVLCAIAYFLMPVLKKFGFIYRKLVSYSANISKMYAVHIGVYMVIGALFAFRGFDTALCLGWSVVVLIVTDGIVYLYNKVEKKLKSK